MPVWGSWGAVSPMSIGTWERSGLDTKSFECIRAPGVYIPRSNELAPDMPSNQPGPLAIWFSLNAIRLTRSRTCVSDPREVASHAQPIGVYADCVPVCACASGQGMLVQSGAAGGV